jgi:hypothetical protein
MNFEGLLPYIKECCKDISEDQMPDIFTNSAGELYLSDWDCLLSAQRLNSFGFVFETSSGYYKYVKETE